MVTRRVLVGGSAGALLGVALAGPARAGATVIETRAVNAFDAVDWHTPGEMLIEQTQRERLTIEAEPHVLRSIVTVVERGTLRVDLAPGASFTTRQPIRVRLESKTLRSLAIRGSGDARITSLAASGGVSFDVSGSGGLRIARLQAATLAARLAGSGGIEVEAGRIDAQRIEITGSGDYQAGHCASADAEVRIDGSGSAQLSVSRDLRVRIDGSGDVEYRGNPRITQTLAGSGTVRRAPN